MAKIKLKTELTISDAFDRFLLSKKSEGLTTKTLSTYKGHLACISHHINIFQSLSNISRSDLEQMISSMRESDLKPNSIASYIRTLKSFLSWARRESLTNLTIPRYKSEETVKETYTDAELKLLLEKPNMRQCSFPEYRNWVIIYFLLNSGARSATIRSILIKDVDIQNELISYRHTKNNRPQIIPLCSQMLSILKEYLSYREGADEDYLFCTENGNQLTEHGLQVSIRRYNKKRGVQKTSIHLFRHTFAKKYLIDCGGDAFSLQRILGHSTLDMTRHYCNLYDIDLVKNYVVHRLCMHFYIYSEDVVFLVLQYHRCLAYLHNQIAAYFYYQY